MTSIQPSTNEPMTSSQRDASKPRITSLPAASVSGQPRNPTLVDSDIMDSPRLTVPNSSSAAATQVPRRSASTNPSAPSSAANSTFSSRESSPVRGSRLPSSSSRPSLSQRTSANSSPNRRAGSVVGTTTGGFSTPSATVIQNAFAHGPQPELLPPPTSIDAVALDSSQDYSSSMLSPPLPGSLAAQPSTARSALKGSPSPSGRRRRSSRSNDSTSCSPAPGGRNPRVSDLDFTPINPAIPAIPATSATPANTSSKRLLTNPPEREETSDTSDAAADNETPSRGMARVSARNPSAGGTPLETVQEASLPSTPMVDKKLREAVNERSPAPQGDSEAAKQATESGSEGGGGNKRSTSPDDGHDQSSASVVSPTSEVIPKRSYSSLNQTRGKAGDASARNMIVETETVSSIPQVSLGVGGNDRSGSTRNDQGGTLRVKLSTETIKPKKEKKKPTRKPAAAGTGKFIQWELSRSIFLEQNKQSRVTDFCGK